MAIKSKNMLAEGDYAVILDAYRTQPIYYLLENRKLVQRCISKCVKTNKLENLSNFWKQEAVLNYLIKELGDKEKRLPVN